jgi:hypothetical protein
VTLWELWIQCEIDGAWGGICPFETEASGRACIDQVRALLAGNVPSTLSPCSSTKRKPAQSPRRLAGFYGAYE